MRACLVAAGLFVFVMARAGAAAPDSGLYLTAADYEQHQVSDGGQCDSKKFRLDLHDVRRTDSVRVINDAGAREYRKADVFGFRDCDGRDYRFVANRGLRILEANRLYIYAAQTPVTSGKGFRTVTDYYFSAGPTGAVQSLTLDNLKRAFPDNVKFHDTLDQMFGAGQNVAQYDEYRNTFKVNRLFLTTN